MNDDDDGMEFWRDPFRLESWFQNALGAVWLFFLALFG